jgi:adenylate cyclase
MDLSQDRVHQIIEESKKDERDIKNMIRSSSLSSTSVKESDSPMISKLYTDKVVKIDYAIRHVQTRMWKALKVKSDFYFDISMEETQKVLKMYAESKATFVILYVDLVDSTRLSMELSANRLATIIRAFTQEMSLIVTAYGGYVLKYIGDAILAFFIVDSSDNLYIRCANAINCACSMMKIIRQGINPILNQYDYPELRVRISIDVGENTVVQLGWDTHTLDGRIVLKDPHLDILGYTINIAAKMTAFAKPNQIVIGQLVYQTLDNRQKSTFRFLSISPEIWNYFSNNTGGIYDLYGSMNESDLDDSNNFIHINPESR